MKKWFLLVSLTVICLALLAGQDDIRRFVRMKQM
jgi:hypothetical protein